jgi:hypothetical protein
MSGLAVAARTYPATAIGLRRCSLSDNHPEKPCTIFCVAGAIPSTRPTTLPLAFNVCVRKIGRTG